MLKIYGRPDSLNVRKVLWLCHEIGIDYERSDWGRNYRPTTDPAFTALSIFGVVPVVDDEGLILRESNTILRYLASKHGRHDLYPTDLRQRAGVELWMDYASVDLANGMRPVFQGGSLGIMPHALPENVAAGKADWNKQFTRVNATLAERGGPYMAGASFTLADIPIGLMVHRWQFLDFEKPTLDAVNAYYQLLSEREGYRKYVRNGTP